MDFNFFKDKIHELAHIHNIEINIYSLEGKLLKSSKNLFGRQSGSTFKYILKLVRFHRKKVCRYQNIDGKKIGI
jgi:hypothetical protein